MSVVEVSDAELWKRFRQRVGVRRVLDACLPVLVFILGFSIVGLGAGLIAAVLVAAALSVLRIVRGEGVRPAVIALAVVALAGLLAHQSGRGVDFFLPDLVGNAALAVWFAVSLIVRRPATALVLRAVGLPGPAAYTRGQMRATAVWLVLWTVHLAFEVPLFLHGDVVALGVVRIVLGPVMWVPVGWLGWRAHRRALADDPVSGSRNGEAAAVTGRAAPEQSV
jgi:hypothetical protein